MNQILPENSQKGLKLSRVALILIILINAAILVLFFSLSKLQSRISFSEKRLDVLEENPHVIVQNNTVPEAGESAKIEIPTTTPFATPFSSIIPSATPTAIPSPTPSVSKQITYIPLYGGNAQTTETSWVDVIGSDFQLKTSDYGKAPYFNWEAIAYVVGGSGEVHIRLFDSTNGVVVSGSEIGGSFTKPSLISSGRLNFFSGNNTYKVQISSLTSSTVEFDFGRVKIVY